jgi:uncharacterized membrane protein YdbT with pleckstrin-like domain
MTHMNYIDKNLLPNEKIIFRTKRHFVIFFAPGILLLLALIFSTSDTLPRLFQSLGPFTMASMSRIPTIAFTVAAVFTGIQQWITYVTSDFVVTNLRVIMRQGFFVRSVTDTRLSTISHVSIDQSLLGQFLNYGTIVINGFGGSQDSFILVATPNEFQKSVQGQLLNVAPR